MPTFNSHHWRQHVALDVGTATIRVATGISSFMEMPSRLGTKPALLNGVVVDGDTTVHILKPLLDRARVFGVVKPCVLACAPSDARAEERQLLADSIMKAGAAALSIIPEPLAAAIGSGVDVSSPYAQMVIDVGEGVTDCAVIRSGKIRATCAIRNGCSHMRASIMKAAQRSGGSCDEFSAERLLRNCGLNGEGFQEGGALAAAALQPVMGRIAGTVGSFLQDLPASLGCDVIDSGICLTGGGALIPGVKEYLERHLRIAITVSRRPLASVAEGARAVLPVVLALNEWH